MARPVALRLRTAGATGSPAAAAPYLPDSAPRPESMGLTRKGPGRSVDVGGSDLPVLDHHRDAACITVSMASSSQCHGFGVTFKF